MWSEWLKSSLSSVSPTGFSSSPCEVSSCNLLLTMDYTSYIGRCLLFFFIAILLDVVGIILFLIGVFAPFSFWDFLVFSGPLLIFLSLVLWIFWYLGNLEVPLEEILPEWDSRSLRFIARHDVWKVESEVEVLIFTFKAFCSCVVIWSLNKVMFFISLGWIQSFYFTFLLDVCLLRNEQLALAMIHDGLWNLAGQTAHFWW